MGAIYRIFRHPLKQYLFAAGAAVVLTLLSLLRNGFALRICYYDALTLAGAAVLMAGLLQLAGYFGAFDIFGYAFSTFRSVHRYEDLFAYSEAKKEKRHRGNWYFMPWLLVGAGFLLVGLCLGIGL